jgi:hypothetical protein
MREHEARRSRTAWRRHPWFKRISNAAAHVSAATLLAAGVADSLAARKHKSRNDNRGQQDQTNTDGNGGNDRNRGDKQGNDPKEDRGHQREHRQKSDGDGDGGNPNRGGKQERQVDESSDVHSVARKQDATETPTPTPTSPSESDGNSGGGGKGNGGGGGRGDGDNDAGNAGSGFFDSPLATKARRRANEFDNAGQDPDDGTFVDVNPDGDSVYETDSVSLTTGPDGIEIVTRNITYFADPTPTPEPLPRLELPDHEPGFPFGEDFPFGNATVVIAPAARGPSSSSDTDNVTGSRAEPIPTDDQSELISSDGGDYTTDFLS